MPSGSTTVVTGLVVSGSTQTPFIEQVISKASSPDMLLTMFVGSIILVRLLVIIRVAKDSVARIKGIFGQLGSILLVTVFTPILGLPIYLVCRPLSLRVDRLAWRQALDLNTVTCPGCKTVNLSSVAHCIFCGKKLTVACKGCQAVFPYDYLHCPTCGHKHAH